MLRALLYWEKVQLLHLEYNAGHEVTGISLNLPEYKAIKTYDPDHEEKLKEDVAETFSETHSKEQYTLDQLDRFLDEESVQEILFITENYLGRTLNPTDIRTILYWYDELHFSTDLIEYLIETCISNGHTSLRYMEKIALSWAEKNIHTVEEAKKDRMTHQKDAYAVMNAFGINGRNLISSEIQTIQKWTGSYAFSMDIIKEACRRTIQATGKPSFEYADSILANWLKQQVHTLSDIVKLDSAHKKARTAAKSSGASKTVSPGGRFNNFPQRTYNYDQLEKQLLNTTR